MKTMAMNKDKTTIGVIIVSVRRASVRGLLAFCQRPVTWTGPNRHRPGCVSNERCIQ